MVKTKVRAHTRTLNGKKYQVKAYEREIGVRTTPRKRPMYKGEPSIFFPPRSEALAEIITLKSPERAKLAVKELEEFDGIQQTRRAIQAATVAANRAEAMMKRKKYPLYPKEMEEMKEIVAIYRAFVKRASARLAKMQA